MVIDLARIKVPLFNRNVVQNAPTDVVHITQQRQSWTVEVLW